jgi:hypothetical protein
MTRAKTAAVFVASYYLFLVISLLQSVCDRRSPQYTRQISANTVSITTKQGIFIALSCTFKSDYSMFHTHVKKVYFRCNLLYFVPK